MGDGTRDLHSAFQKDHRELCLYRAKIALLVGISVVPFFAGLDFILAREHFRVFLLARLAVTAEAILMLSLILFSRPIGLRFSSFFVSFYCITVGGILSSMCLKLGGFNSTYYVGIIIVILGASLVMPWRPGYHLFMTVGMYLTYLSQLLFVGINAPLGTFINNNYFLFAAVGMTYIGSVLQYRMHFLLKQKDQHKTDFFNNVSHELKTPLTLIMSPVKRLLFEVEGIPTAVRQDLEVVLKNSEGLFALIKTLLETAKMEAGMMQLRLQPIRPLRLCRDLMERSKPALGEKGIEARFFADGDPVVYADKDHVVSILSNLYSNAIKFSDKKPIDTFLEEMADEIVVTIKDYGPGLTRKEQKEVFLRFRQTDTGLKRQHGGTGIGLNYARGLVHLHKGEMTVASEKGEWTAFRFTLKKGDGWFLDRPHVRLVQEERGEAVDVPRPPGEREILLEKKVRETPAAGTILVVDDNRDLREHIKGLLSGRYDIRTAVDGEEGLRIAREILPDLVLTDIMMPKMDGHELVAAIRADGNLRETPIIMLTAHGDDEGAVYRGFKSGANDYILKPFSPRELLVRIDNLIRLRRHKEEIRRQRDELAAVNQTLKETEAELVQTEKLSTVGLLAAGVAHEINNPAYSLTMSLANIENLVDEVSPSLKDRLQHHLKRGQEEIERIKRIVKTLLGYSQKNREGITLCDLSKDIESTLVLLKKSIDDSGATIHWDHESGRGPIEADHAAVNQVFTNLLQNSLQAGAKNIWIEVDDDDSTSRIRVADDGCGISSDAMPHIFEPFFTTKEVGNGAGLGLNIVHRIVNRHHGEIMVASQVGKGTEFRIILPARQPQPPQPKEELVKKQPTQPLSPLHNLKS